MFPNSKTDAEQEVVVRTLTQLLEACVEGEVVSYSVMKRETNLDIQKNHRHLLYRAIRDSSKEAKCRFACEIGIGYKKLAPDQWAGATVRDVSVVKRAARRGRKRVATLDLSRTSNEDRTVITATSGVLAAIEQSARRSIRGYKPLQVSTSGPVVAPAESFIPRKPFRRNVQQC